jgi:hypothetical protein
VSNLQDEFLHDREATLDAKYEKDAGRARERVSPVCAISGGMMLVLQSCYLTGSIRLELIYIHITPASILPPRCETIASYVKVESHG